MIYLRKSNGLKLDLQNNNKNNQGEVMREPSET